MFQKVNTLKSLEESGLPFLGAFMGTVTERVAPNRCPSASLAVRWPCSCSWGSSSPSRARPSPTPSVPCACHPAGQEVQEALNGGT